MNDTPVETATQTTDTPQVLLDHHLKELRLPTILREYPGPQRPLLSLGWESTTAWQGNAPSNS